MGGVGDLLQTMLVVWPWFRVCTQLCDHHLVRGNVVLPVMLQLRLTKVHERASLRCGPAPTFFCLTAVGVVAICASVLVSTLPSRLIVAGLELDPRPSAVPGDIGASAKAVPGVLLRPLADVWLLYSWLAEA